MFDDEPYQNAVLGYTERRLRQRGQMPELTTCTKCRLPYYQTSAPHVCAGWATKEEKMNRNTTGYPVIDQILESITPTTEQEHQHEPVARGGEGEWRLEHVATNTRGTKTLFHRGTPVAIVGTETLNDHQRALDMTTALNQHHSLLAERERLREALRSSLKRLVDRGMVEREIQGTWPDCHWLYRVTKKGRAINDH